MKEIVDVQSVQSVGKKKTLKEGKKEEKKGG